MPLISTLYLKIIVSKFFIFVMEIALYKVKMSQFIVGSLLNNIMLQT